MQKMESVKASFHSMELFERPEILLSAAENFACNLRELLRLNDFEMCKILLAQKVTLTGKWFCKNYYKIRPCAEKMQIVVEEAQGMTESLFSVPALVSASLPASFFSAEHLFISI